MGHQTSGFGGMDSWVHGHSRECGKYFSDGMQAAKTFILAGDDASNCRGSLSVMDVGVGACRNEDVGIAEDVHLSRWLFVERFENGLNAFFTNVI